MKKIKLFLFILIFISKIDSKAQVKNSIPEYSSFLKKINAENLDIDYRKFRISYLSSEKFKKKETSDYNKLKLAVYKYIKKENYNKIIGACQNMLEIDYTSLFAHKHLQETAHTLGDTVLYKKHHDIEFGLIKSIVNSGEGVTCKTAWEVTQIEEEEFILKTLGAQLKQKGFEGLCDRIEVTQNNKNETYYFKVYYLFENGK